MMCFSSLKPDLSTIQSRRLSINVYAVSGGVLIKARRTLIQAARPPANTASPDDTSSPKADEDSFAFTIAVISMSATIFVNWALVDATKVVEWHMHRLRQYDFHRLDELSQLHHDVDNILDWGVTSRKRRVVELCGDIEKQQAVVEKAKTAT